MSKLILASLTHNDMSKGWLGKWLENNSKYCDSWVIVDDCSDDGTWQEIGNFTPKNDIPIHVYQTEEPTFKTHENKIREMLWNKVKEVAEEGDIILVLDSDELLTEDFKDFKSMVKNVNLDSPQFIFKKCEMWNEKEYRVDGLWSNYFIRGFLFKDKPWGYDAKGFHFPQIPKYAFSSGEIVNTDLRIKHLAYYTEELRKSKYDFMMKNEQQKKDITYYHLQTTCDKNPKLKTFEEIISWPDNHLILVCNNLYKLEQSVLQTLKNHYYKGTVYLDVYINKCHPNLITQINSLDLNVETFSVTVKTYDEIEPIPYRNAMLKREIIDDINPKENSYIIFIDGHTNITPAYLKHIVTTDKDVLLDRRGMNIFAVNDETLKYIKKSKNYLATNGNSGFNIILAHYLKSEGNNVWGISGGAPFPMDI